MTKLSPLTSVSATREVLEAHGLVTKKALGQHFLINDGVVSRICDLAQLASSDEILEVGPGIGTLTLGLLRQAGNVVAIERDTDLPAVLAETCAGHEGHFLLINKDALEVSESEIQEALAKLPAPEEATSEGLRFPSKLVSNLPYAVAATIVLDFFERFDALQSQTVMVQSEVADRMCAKPGTKAYGAYTVKLSLYAQPAGRFTVSPGNFFPPPRVDSAVVRLDRQQLCDASGVPLDRKTIKAAAIMADAAFANRRKTILNSCKTYFSLQGEEVSQIIERLPAIFEEANISPSVRGEALTKEDYLRLGQAFQKDSNL